MSAPTSQLSPCKDNKVSTVRGLQSRKRMEEHAGPQLESLARQRYGNDGAVAATTPAPPATGRAQRSARPAASGTRPPAKTVKIPKTIEKLLSAKQLEATAASTALSPRAIASPSRTPKAFSGTSAPATTHERVGQLYQPYCGARTPFAEREAQQRRHGSPLHADGHRHLAPAPLPQSKGAQGPSTFYALEDFDNTEEDLHTPQEWVALGAASGGTPALSRHFDGNTQESAWAPCKVTAYDEDSQTFTIQWADGTARQTTRLNIRFAEEKEGQWRTRVRQAEQYRAATEAALRLKFYLDSIPNEAVTPYDEGQTDRALEMVADHFPVSLLHIIHTKSQEAEDAYYRGAKRAVHEYNMGSAEEQARLASLQLPPIPAQPLPSLTALHGTLLTPSPNYGVARMYLEENLFQAHALLHDTLHRLHTLWFDYQDRTLCLTATADMEGGAAPLQLASFVEQQRQRGSAVGDKLRGEWSSIVQSTLQNNLDPYFNFYEDNIARFEESRMYRFVRLVNTMMTTQLRGLLVDSLEKYTAFIAAYHVHEVDDDVEMTVLPEDEAERAHWRRRVTGVAEKRQSELELQVAAEMAAGKKKRNTIVAPEGEAPPADRPAEPSLATPADSFAWSLGSHTCTIPYTQRVLDLTHQMNGFQPLFALRLVESAHRDIAFDPPLAEVEDQVLHAYDACFDYAGRVSGMGDQLFPLLEMKPYCLAPVDTAEPVVCSTRALVEETMERNRVAPLQLLQMYKEFDYLLRADGAAVVAQALQQQLPLDEFDLLFERVTRDIARIKRRTPNDVKYEIYAVNCGEMKKLLVARAQKLLNVVMEGLSRRLATECAEVIQEYEVIHERLSIDPTTPEELQELRLYLDSVPAKEEAIQKKFVHVSEGNELLLKYCFLVPQPDFVQYWEAYEWPKKLQQFVEDRNFRAKEYRAMFIQDLRDNCERLTFDIMQLAANVEDFTHLGDDARAEEHYERARGIAQLIETHQASAALYSSHEELFGMAVSQYPQLKEIRDQFDPYFSLWEITCHFNVEAERCTSAKLSSLVPMNVDQKITDWGKRVILLSKKIKEPEPSEVARQLRANIERFKPNIPLLYALRSHLQATHWRAIYHQCGVPKDQQGFGAGGVDNNNIRPFSEFLQLGMLDHLTQIESIATIAQKTYELETELMDMETEWKRLSFEMEAYQDTYKLKANEMMQLTLDDHILKTQSMLGKPTVRQTPALQARVTQWDKQLDNIQCTMDEWFRCQNTWAYLEPIFSSADISRSLPKEKQLFVDIDESWHSIMEHTKMTPQILARCQDESLIKTLREANDTLEIILRKLQQFLETKRMAFPRFYFISNEELLQILSDSKDPYLVQPYLCKCFEGLSRLRFAGGHDMIGMESAEGEYVPFVKKVNPVEYSNQVELWLQGVEHVMKDSIRDQLHQAIGDYASRPRTEFIRAWPGQVVLAVCCLFWTMEATQAMKDGGAAGLTTYHEKCVSQLDDLIVLVRDKNLGTVERCTLEALVVIEVHSKDIIGTLCAKGVDSPNDFEWLSQLRYYWEEDHLDVQQINASLRYGYEYLGNSGRLVITPLTDRCYRTLIGALHLNYGGAPEGPAGTGKTETTKDLAKALGKYCVVYNCSDQISAKDMAKLFKGLTQAGAWGCFDEFNRIEIQVLSVIAQQVATIQEAIVQKKPEFIFEGAQIRMDSGCAIFITMNPGYAGRAELPDNLKALFRPVAMMVPNYAMIGEIQLYSYGFLHGKVLSEKIVATYRLCSEQLSSQDHYDYGMRAVKAVLTAAGRLKRTYPDEDEMVLMLRSIQDVNLPKFLSQDVELFRGIVSDLFPDVCLPSPDYEDMHRGLVTVCEKNNLQLTPYFEEKIRQTYEMICVRHGMMIVGFSHGGKTKGIESLAGALGLMSKEGKEQAVRRITMNPKSVTMSQLYGKVEQSGEWTDGILSNRFRQLAQDTSGDRVWLILDGPVDAVWIENMNTVLDDNKKLCLQNGDIIPMSKRMNLIFEVQDLAHASPATVSRCGMVYVEPTALGWACLMESYLNTLPPFLSQEAPLMAAMRGLVDAFMEEMLEVVRKQTHTVIPQGASTAVASFIKLFSSFTKDFDEDVALQRVGDEGAHDRLMVMRVEGWFLFSLVWSVGGCLFHSDRELFSDALHDLVASKAAAGAYKFTIPLFEKEHRFFDMYLCDDLTEVRFANWMDAVPELVIPDGSEYQDIIVPTSETAKYTFLVNAMIKSLNPTLLVGDTGTGKTIMMKSLLKALSEESYSLCMIQFSAQTTSSHLQRLIDGSCEKRRKGFYGPPVNKNLMIFIDDANMPQLEEYGAQPPIELLRQYLDHGGWYNVSKDGIDFHHMVDMLLLCAMGPAGGGRNPVTQRFTRHFNAISVPSFNEQTLRTIFGRLTDWILGRGFTSSLRSQSTALVGATVELYETLVDKLKPSPEKSHYTFNLRDVSKVFQGISMAFAPRIRDDVALAELWMHEVSRAFADRFICDADTAWFNNEASKVCVKHFKAQVSPVDESGNPMLFTGIANDDNNYERVSDLERAREVLEQRLETYNLTSRQGDLNLVIFNYVLEHVARISRVLRQPGGNLLLVGVGGSGRRSCTRLAAYLQECDYTTITATKEYDHSDFLEDIRKVLLRTGQKGYSTAFVLSDSEIASESFLEDICSLLNTGEIPGLWEAKQDREIFENAVASLREVGRNLGRPDTAEALRTLFVERCRKHMHMVLCFSPLGTVFRERLRKFPSLVNCSSIDWFREWPEDGLHSVATRFLSDVDLTEPERQSIGELFVQFQQHVRDLGADYLLEARQHTYVTPTSYLDLLSTFGRLLTEKRSELTAMRDRYMNGLTQLRRTEDQVEVMQKELAEMRPQLAKKQEETNVLIAQVESESKIAEKQKAAVAVDEAAANEQATAAKRMKDASQEKVDEAQPLVEQAQRAVLDLDPKALQEVKALKAPPQGVKYVIEVLCTLLGGVYKPKPIRDPLTQKTTIPYWEHAKTTLLTGEFKNTLLNAYSEIVDNAPDSQIDEVVKKMSDDMFKMENIRKTSVALVGVATYIKAVVEYYKQNKVIRPLLAQAAAAQAEYDEAMEGLRVKKEELRVITDKLQALTSHLDQVNADKRILEDRVNDTDTKLTRAKKLIEGLGGEKARFAREGERYEEELQYVVGNVVVSAGIVAYMGPFLHKYRLRAVESWVTMCRDNGILVGDKFSLDSFCGSPIDIQEWKLQQLPTDPFSVDNAVMMKASSRWPLLIDPQQQANRWIRNRERDHNLVVVRPSEKEYLRVIRQAIAEGRPVLLENLDETLDPMLDNLLLKRITREGTMWVMHLGEAVEWNPKFRFYMTTKLPRPHYLPEVSTKVTLINFMITEQGLQDQLLQRVMMSERREVEEKKQALTLEAAANQAGLKSTEDRILAILSSEGNILESEEAIEELDNSKEQSDRIAKRQEEIEAMERISDRTRNMFIPVAHLGAILFFCVTEMANIDPMYQNSLQSYMSIFQEALAKSAKSDSVDERIANVNETFKVSLYQRICRSLFARDQLLFSFNMSLKIYAVDPVLLRWVLMGGFESDDVAAPANPFDWMPELSWKLFCRASTQLPAFKDLLATVSENELLFHEYYEASNPFEVELPSPLREMSTAEKMVVARCLRMDKVIPAVTAYVRETLGDLFVEPPLYALETVVDELAYDPSVPIILVLSPGADPNAELDRVADLRGMSQNRLYKLSLGQGQDAPARELIEAGTRQGHWVFLQNCHLHADFMPSLARLIEDYSDITARDKLNREYRLWLTSLPSDIFPIAILQNGVKLVQEPPKGLKSNLLQSYLADPVADEAFFDSSNKPEVWRKMLFGLCFFHAVVQERRQYGPLGWNRPYEFNDTDRRISIRQLNMFLNENDAVPYEALQYLIGECNYGGRVTDDWDRRCLLASLQVYLTPLVLDDEYAFCEDADEYYAPPYGDHASYVDYVQHLPLEQPPSIFGLHENADITKDERDAKVLLEATLSTQPREPSTSSSSSSAAKLDPKATVKQLAGSVLARLPKLFDVEEIQRVYPIDYAQSMNTVLLQEAIRYNRLLAVVRKSLAEVQDAIDGKVVMSSELETVFNNIYDGKIPELWRKRSYPSLKPFGSYVSDLVARLQFLQTWCQEGPPAMYWLSGFFFTQSFLTGVMQNYARKRHIEIDKLTWDFTVLTETEKTSPPEDGCYVYGLFLEGAGWDGEVLAESRPKELFISFPLMQLVPCREEEVAPKPVYRCPCYKTTDRKGVLSTTGHSTNFILTVNLPRAAEDTEDHWVLRGVALFTQLEN